MQMDYFRRPILAGKALQRLNAGHLRGSLRRLDPDGTSAVPYFAGVSATQTLLLTVDGTPFTVTLTGSPPTFQSIISDINAALTTSGKATDDAGCIGIQTFTQGGFIQVTGGTAAAALGFDITTQRFRSAAGDMNGAPERGLGNPFGAAFPTRGEDFIADSSNRALARLSANLDVLYSEHVRQDARMVKIAAGSTTVSSPATGTSIITLPATTRVFTGAGLLPTTPTPESLAPFIQLIDPTTGLPPATCRVVDVVRGTVVGSPPYADAASYAGFGSVVNVDLIKVSGSITGVKNGRVITVSGATFTSNGTKVGDWAKITGATNVTPWSNNGYRWVVEEIIDNTHVALRPMSNSEAAQAGLSGNTEEQPIVELNEFLGGGQTYGTLEIHTGTFTDGVKLVIQPQMPANATYDVYVAQPLSLRESNSGTGDRFPLIAQSINQLNPVPNGVISGFAVTSFGPSSAFVNIAEGFIRLHGKILHIPATQYNAVDFVSDGTYIVYFDELDSRVKFASTLPGTSRISYDPTVTDTHAVVHPLHFVTVGSGATQIGSFTYTIARFATPNYERITVGNGGDFDDLSVAAFYVNALAAAHSETTSSSAAYPHFEIVLLNSQTAANPIEFSCPSISVRGATRLVVLTLSADAAFTLDNCYFFEARDLVLDTQNGETIVGINAHTDTANGLDCRLIRCSHVSGGIATTVIQSLSANGKLKKLAIDDCSLNLVNGITQCNAPTTSQQDISIARSVLTYVGDGTQTIMFTPFSGVGSGWTGSSVTARDNFFNGWWTDDLAGSVVMKFDNGSAKFSCEDNVWTPGTFPTNSTASLWNVGATSGILFAGNIFKAQMPRAIHHLGNTALSVVVNNLLQLAPHGTAADTEGCTAAIISNNNIVLSIPSSNSPGVVLAPTRTCMGNTVSGSGLRAIGTVSGSGNKNGVVIHGNNITINSGALTGVRCAGIDSGGSKNRITNNVVSVTTTSGYAASAAGISVSNVADNLVEGNAITHAGCFAFLALNSGATGAYCNNRSFNTVDSGVANAGALSFRGRWFVKDSEVFGTGLTGFFGLKTQNGTTEILAEGLFVDCPVGISFTGPVTAVQRFLSSVFTGSGDFSSVTEAKVEDCRFDGAFTSQLRGSVAGSRFGGNVTFTARATSSDTLRVAECDFLGGTVTANENGGQLNVLGCKFLVASSFVKTGTGYVVVDDNDIQAELDASNSIDLFTNNRISSGTNIVLTGGEVSGNVFDGGGTVALTGTRFLNNDILDMETDLTACVLDSNTWDPANTGFLQLDGLTQSSNNIYHSTSTIAVTGNLMSSNDFFGSTVSLGGQVSMTGTTATVDIDMSGSTGPNYLSNVATTGDILLGGASASISSCNANTLSTATWSGSQVVNMIGGHYTGDVSLTSSGGVRSGSKLAMTGVVCEGAYAMSGQELCQVVGGYDGAASNPSQFAHITELVMTGFRASRELSITTVTQCYLDAVHSPSLGFVLAAITTLRMHGCQGPSISATAIGSSVSIQGSLDTLTITITYVTGCSLVAVTGNHHLVVDQSGFGISVMGTANAALLERLTINNNTIDCRNEGSSTNPAYGVQVGNQGLSVANQYQVRHAEINGNQINVHTFPNTIALGIGDDRNAAAFNIPAKVHSGGLSGNTVSLPSPLVFGGGTLHYRFIEGPVFDANTVGLVCAANCFTKCAWSAGSPSTPGAETSVTDHYDVGDGVNTSVVPTGTDDIYGGGFRKLLNSATNRAFVPVTLS